MTPLPAAIGEVIGPYRLEGVLSVGGMGCIYRASNVRGGDRVAVKVLLGHLSDDAEIVARFVREAQIAQSVDSAHIVDIFGVVAREQPPRVALVMELIEGPTLRAHIARGRTSVRASCIITRQIARGIEALHDSGVIHRDLKPSNVMLQALPGGGQLVKILDFGVGKMESNVDDVATSAGSMLGTPTYMSPEQVMGATVTRASDVYAIGEILYELIAGRPAFSGPRMVVLRAKVDHGAPMLPFPHGLEAEARLEAIVRACLDPVPMARPTVDELDSELAHIEACASADAGLDVVDAPTLPLQTELFDATVPCAPPAFWRSSRARQGRGAAPCASRKASMRSSSGGPARCSKA